MEDKNQNIEKTVNEAIMPVETVEVPKYLIAESIEDMKNIKISLFDLNLEELVYEKMSILFEKLYQANNNLEDAKVNLQIETDKILLETDFKSLGLTNEKMRQAHIKTLTTGLEDKVDEKKEIVQFYKNKLTIINDLITVRKLELKIEANLQREEF